MRNGQLIDRQSVDFNIPPWPVVPTAGADVAQRYNDALSSLLRAPLEWSSQGGLTRSLSSASIRYGVKVVAEKGRSVRIWE